MKVMAMSALMILPVLLMMTSVTSAPVIPEPGQKGMTREDAPKCGSQDVATEVVNLVSKDIKKLTDAKKEQCKRPAVKTLGSKKGHWTAIGILLDVLFKNGGAGFPDGVFFATSAGGLPAPTAAAKKQINKILDEFVEYGSNNSLKICASDFESQVVDAFQKFFYSGDDDIDMYLSKHCGPLIALINGKHCFLTVNSGKQLLRSVQKTAKDLGNSGDLQVALVDLLFTFFAGNEDSNLG